MSMHEENFVTIDPETGETIGDPYGRPLNAKGKPLTANGEEIPHPIPMAPPLGYIKQPSLVDRIREMVRSEHLRRAAEESGHETFEEGDDLEVGDDYDPASPYEYNFDPPSPAPVSPASPPKEAEPPAPSAVASAVPAAPPGPPKPPLA